MPCNFAPNDDKAYRTAGPWSTTHIVTDSTQTDPPPNSTSSRPSRSSSNSRTRSSCPDGSAKKRRRIRCVRPHLPIRPIYTVDCRHRARVAAGRRSFACCDDSGDTCGSCSGAACRGHHTVYRPPRRGSSRCCPAGDCRYAATPATVYAGGWRAWLGVPSSGRYVAVGIECRARIDYAGSRRAAAYPGRSRRRRATHDRRPGCCGLVVAVVVGYRGPAGADESFSGVEFRRRRLSLRRRLLLHRSQWRHPGRRAPSTSSSSRRVQSGRASRLTVARRWRGNSLPISASRSVPIARS